MLKKAARLLPDNAETQPELGYAALNLKRYDEAMAAYQVVRLQPDNARAHYLAGWAANGAGKFADAVAALTRATEIEPKNTPAQSELGYAYRNLKRYAEAQAAYQRRSASTRNSRPRIAAWAWPLLRDPWLSIWQHSKPKRRPTAMLQTMVLAAGPRAHGTAVMSANRPR